MNISENISKIVKNSGYKEFFVCESLGISKTALWQWKSGKSVPNAERLKDFCIFFNISADFLLDLPQNMPFPELFEDKSIGGGVIFNEIFIVFLYKIHKVFTFSDFFIFLLLKERAMRFSRVCAFALQNSACMCRKGVF